MYVGKVSCVRCMLAVMHAGVFQYVFTPVGLLGHQTMWSRNLGCGMMNLVDVGSSQVSDSMLSLMKSNKINLLVLLSNSKTADLVVIFWHDISCLVFTNIGGKSKKCPVGSSSVVGYTLIMREFRRAWSDWFKLAGRLW